MPRPVKPGIVKNRIAQLVREFTVHNVTVTRGQKGAVQGSICHAWPDENIRHACIAWIFDSEKPLHMSELTDPQVMALKRWINAKNIQGEWVPENGWNTETQWIEFTVNPLPKEPVLIAEEYTELGDEPEEEEEGMVEFLLKHGGQIVEISEDPESKTNEEDYTFD